MLRNRSVSRFTPLERTIISLTFFLTTACAPMTINNLRTEAPTGKKTYSVRYEDIGNCVLEAARSGERSLITTKLANHNFETSTQRQRKLMAVTGYDSGSIKVPWIDILFIGNNDVSTTVETRRGGISGGLRTAGETAETEIWPLIDNCASELTKSK